MYVYDYDTQSYSKKSYLDLFLENNTIAKKRGIYFGNVQETAIIRYNDASTSEKEKNELFKKLIGPSFRKIIYGVLEMPNFRHLGKLNREELIDNTFFRLIEKIYKFQPGMIGKTGQPVKAYSYFSTIAKNYILEQKLRNEKVLKNKADVESSIDLAILSEDTLEKMSNYDRQDVELDDYVANFRNTKITILTSVLEILYEEENSEKQDKDLIKLGYVLKYMIEKWDKIEFAKKNEFMRILTLYTGLPQQRVSFLFKKFKIGSLKKLKPSALTKKKEKVEKEKVEKEEPILSDIEIDADFEGKDFDSLEGIDDEIKELGIEDDGFAIGVLLESKSRSEEHRKRQAETQAKNYDSSFQDVDEYIVSSRASDFEDEPEIPEGYTITSMEEFEQQLYRHENNKNKAKMQWKKKKKSEQD